MKSSSFPWSLFLKCWGAVIAAALLFLAIGARLKSIGGDAYAGLPTPGPQAFCTAESLGEARNIAVYFQTAPDGDSRHLSLDAVHSFFAWDVAFIFSYVLLFTVLGVTLNQGLLTIASGRQCCAKVLAALCPWAGVAALVAAGCDLMENRACLRLAEGDYSLLSLAQAHLFNIWKWISVAIVTVLLLPAWVYLLLAKRKRSPAPVLVRAGFESMDAMDAPQPEPPRAPVRLKAKSRAPEGQASGFEAVGPPPGNQQAPGGRLATIWILLSRTAQFAIRARFSILGCMVLGLLLILTDPGRDVVRCAFKGVAFSGFSNGPDKVAWGQLGGLLFAFSVLCAQCMGWARLALAQKLEGAFGSSDEMRAIEANTQQRLRRDLPGVIGSYALLTGAAAFFFSDRLINDSIVSIPEALAWFLGPVLLMLVPPLAAVVKASRKPKEDVWRRRMLTGKTIGVPLLLVAFVTGLFLHNSPAMAFGLMFAVTAAMVWYVQNTWPCLAIAALHGVLAAMDGAWLATLPSLMLAGFIVVGNRIGRKFDGSSAFELETTPGPVDLMRAMLGEIQEHFQQWAFWRNWSQEEEKVWFRWAVMSVCFHTAMFSAFLLWNHAISRWFGGGGVLVFGVTAMVCAGSVLVWFTQSLKLPVASAALVWAVLCGWMTNNHYVRVVESPAAAGQTSLVRQRKEITDHFKQWLEPRKSAAAKTGRKVPCIVVAAEGGGIRAAYWTALVLATLQDRSMENSTSTSAPPPDFDFASSVYAISGVSGGSLGTAYFAAMCSERPQGNMREHARRLCGSDHLAPLLGRMTYADALQRFLPLPLFHDRAAALEHSWETAWNEAGIQSPQNPMSRGMMNLWSSSHPVPAIFLNGTDVDSGKRSVLSNVRITRDSFADAIDAYDSLQDPRHAWDVPLSTAAHHSARFPYFNPPGTMPGGQRVVDGGLFENSGASTAQEIVAALRALGGDQIDLRVIYIDYQLSVIAEEPPLIRGRWFNESLTPPLTLARTRGARASYHQAEMSRVFSGIVVQRFKADPDNGEVPLSWTLSGDAALNLDKDISDGKTPPDSKTAKENEAEAVALLKFLRGQP